MRCYAFTCPRCEYTAHVCGTPDNASGCFSTTVHCRDCQALYDVATHIRLPATSAMKERAKNGGLESRFPRKFDKSELHSILPEQVWVGETIINTRPTLPPGLLDHDIGGRWVELATRCPSAPFHNIEPWNHPGRCPRCRTYLDKSLIPFRVTD